MWIMVMIVISVMLATVVMMAIGTIFGRNPIVGSCGGLGKITGESDSCAICGNDPSRCEEAIDIKSVVAQDKKTKAN